MKIIKIFKDVIAPKKCYNCKKEGAFLCSSCFKEIWNFENICYVCKAKSRNFEVHDYCENDFIYYDKIIILTHYKNKIIKKLIKDAKFYHKKDILEDFSIYIWELLFENIKEQKDEIVLIPTPMYFFKRLSRWYNQSEVLVSNISKNFWIIKTNKIIKKIKSTKSQSHLTKIQRIENLKNTFKINLKELQRYKNKTFVIVDDVVSTWTTINEISKILKVNWIKKVYALSLASD